MNNINYWPHSHRCRIMSLPPLLIHDYCFLIHKFTHAYIHETRNVITSLIPKRATHLFICVIIRICVIIIRKNGLYYIERIMRRSYDCNAKLCMIHQTCSVMWFNNANWRSEANESVMADELFAYHAGNFTPCRHDIRCVRKNTFCGRVHKRIINALRLHRMIRTNENTR